MRTQQQAIAAAGAALAEARALRDSLPVAEAARIAWTPTGPTLAELEARIAARRGIQTSAPAVDAPRPRRERTSRSAAGPQPGAESGEVSGFESRPAPGARGTRKTA